MNILCICPDYPNYAKGYESAAFAFVHRRNQALVKSKFVNSIDVLCNLNSSTFVPQYDNYEYMDDAQKIRVLRQANILELKEYYDLILIHFPNIKTINTYNKIKKYYKQVTYCVFMYGHEILFTLTVNYCKNKIRYFSKKLIAIPRQIYQKFLIKNLLKNSKLNIFTSNYLYMMYINDIILSTPWSSVERNIIIPCPIDLNHKKTKVVTSLKHGVCVKNFNNNHYGFEEIIKIYNNPQLTRLPNLTIYGTGPMYEKLLKKVSKVFYNNKLKIINKIFTENELKELFCKYDFYLACSKHETQGVTMCEAMSCGLIPIGINIDAVSEFAPFKELLVNNYKQLGKLLNNLYKYDKYDISSFTHSSVQSIRTKLNPLFTTDKLLNKLYDIVQLKQKEREFVILQNDNQ